MDPPAALSSTTSGLLPQLGLTSLILSILSSLLVLPALLPAELFGVVVAYFLRGFVFQHLSSTQFHLLADSSLGTTPAVVLGGSLSLLSYEGCKNYEMQKCVTGPNSGAICRDLT